MFYTETYGVEGCTTSRASFEDLAYQLNRLRRMAGNLAVSHKHSICPLNPCANPSEYLVRDFSYGLLNCYYIYTKIVNQFDKSGFCWQLTERAAFSKHLFPDW